VEKRFGGHTALENKIFYRERIVSKKNTYFPVNHQQLKKKKLLESCNLQNLGCLAFEYIYIYIFHTASHVFFE